MKKHFAIGSAFAVALGVAACTPPADGDGETAPEAATAPEEEVTTDETPVDGTMTGETSAEEGEGEGGDTQLVDKDGNPIHN